MSVHETYLSTIWTLCRTCQCSPVSKFGRLALHLVGRCKSSLIGPEWQLKRSCVLNRSRASLKAALQRFWISRRPWSPPALNSSARRKTDRAYGWNCANWIRSDLSSWLTGRMRWPRWSSSPGHEPFEGPCQSVPRQRARSAANANSAGRGALPRRTHDSVAMSSNHESATKPSLPSATGLAATASSIDARLPRGIRDPLRHKPKPVHAVQRILPDLSRPNVDAIQSSFDEHPPVLGQLRSDRHNQLLSHEGRDLARATAPNSRRARRRHEPAAFGAIPVESDRRSKRPGSSSAPLRSEATDPQGRRLASWALRLCHEGRGDEGRRTYDLRRLTC
jgi:hypothetical protein